MFRSFITSFVLYIFLNTYLGPAYSSELILSEKQIKENIIGRIKEFGYIIYDFRENMDLYFNNGINEVQGKWYISDGKVCVKFEAQNQKACFNLSVNEHKDILYHKVDKDTGKEVVIYVNDYGDSKYNYENAVYILRKKRLLQDKSLNDAQSKFIINNIQHHENSVVEKNVIENYKKECTPTTFIDELQSLGNLMKGIAPQQVKNDCRDLINSYRDYIRIRKCYEERIGQQSVFVTDVEMENSKRIIYSIEKIIKNKSPYIDTDWVWSRADESIPVTNYFGADLDLYRSTKYQESEYEIKRKVCDLYLSNLKDKLYKMDPSEFKTKKDF
jgi:hypothetical protein